MSAWLHCPCPCSFREVWNRQLWSDSSFQKCLWERRLKKAIIRAEMPSQMLIFPLARTSKAKIFTVEEVYCVCVKPLKSSTASLPQQSLVPGDSQALYVQTTCNEIEGRSYFLLGTHHSILQGAGAELVTPVSQVPCTAAWACCNATGALYDVPCATMAIRFWTGVSKALPNDEQYREIKVQEILWYC